MYLLYKEKLKLKQFVSYMANIRNRKEIHENASLEYKDVVAHVLGEFRRVIQFKRAFCTFKNVKAIFKRKNKLCKHQKDNEI